MSWKPEFEVRACVRDSSAEGRVGFDWPEQVSLQ